jgi:DNA-binding transcriptional MocR family regulator
VSPLQLLLLAALVGDTIEIGIDAAFRQTIETNRKLVLDLVEDDLVRRASPKFAKNVPFELLELSEAGDTTRVWQALRDRGVHILPAHNYYWSTRVSNQFRLPLARPTQEIEAVLPVIRHVLNQGMEIH